MQGDPSLPIRGRVYFMEKVFENNSAGGTVPLIDKPGSIPLVIG
jgi:hypothetical protein